MIVCMRIVLEMRSRDELDFKLVRLNWLYPKGSDGCTFSTCATIIGSAVISELPPAFFAGPAGHLNNNSSKRWNSFYAS